MLGFRDKTLEKQAEKENHAFNLFLFGDKVLKSMFVERNLI